MTPSRPRRKNGRRRADQDSGQLAPAAASTKATMSLFMVLPVLSFTVSTGTGTVTVTGVNPEAEKKDDSGCSYGSGNVLRTLGPWSIALVGVLLAALRRRRK